jgi:hypothetical protein
MSIISEALKKADSDRHLKQANPQGPAARSASRNSWLTSVAILGILVLPFAMPRLLGRTAPAGAPDASADAPLRTAFSADTPSLPLADAPDARSASGLAQVAVETAGIPMAMAPVTPVAITRDFGQLQGIVWTEDKGYYAILNNEVVRVGSRVGSMRVTRITPMGLELSDGTRKEFIEKAF